jgi:hypothetical protein
MKENHRRSWSRDSAIDFDSVGISDGTSAILIEDFHGFF